MVIYFHISSAILPTVFTELFFLRQRMTPRRRLMHRFEDMQRLAEAPISLYYLENFLKTVSKSNTYWNTT